MTEQIAHAEALGFDSAWVAQHHFHELEGGLPSPVVFLAHVAARTRRIRLGTGIVTLPMENAVRVAEDAIVLDLLSGGRLELGVGTGGEPSRSRGGNDGADAETRRLRLLGDPAEVLQLHRADGGEATFTLVEGAEAKGERVLVGRERQHAFELHP